MILCCGGLRSEWIWAGKALRCPGQHSCSSGLWPCRFLPVPAGEWAFVTSSHGGAGGDRGAEPSSPCCAALGWWPDQVLPARRDHTGRQRGGQGSQAGRGVVVPDGTGVPSAHTDAREGLFKELGCGLQRGGATWAPLACPLEAARPLPGPPAPARPSCLGLSTWALKT